MSNSRKRPARFRDDKDIKKVFDFSNVKGTRFLIPSKAAGSMIGRGGEIIKDIRSRFPECRIIVPDSDGPERIVLCDGPIDVIVKIWEDILPSLKEWMNAKDCDYSGRDIKSSQSSEEYDLRLLVHESIVGSIIGRGGDRVKNLIEEHRVSFIKVSPNMCPKSTDRIVRLVGRLSCLVDCLKKILEILATQDLKGHREDYNPNYYDESIASGYGGFISKDQRFPSRRSNPDRFEEMPLTRSIQNNHSYRSNDEPRRFSHGRNSNSAYESDRIDDNLKSMHDFLLNNTMSRHRASPPPLPLNLSRDILTGSIALPDPNDLGMHVAKVTVKPYLVEAIMGRDEYRLLDIKQDSGADIELNIDRLTEENIFVIRGDADQIFRAQCLLQLCARKYGNRDRPMNYY